MITSSATNDSLISNMSLIDENACTRCKEERHGIGGGSDNSIDMYKCQVGCQAMVLCEVIHSDRKEQLHRHVQVSRVYYPNIITIFSYILGIQSTRFQNLPNMSTQGGKVMLKSKSGRWIEKSCLFVRK